MLEQPKAQGATSAKILVDETKVEMVNQQITQIEFGWLSGIIDGEGYIGIQYYKTRHGYMSVKAEVSITNTDEKIILKAQKIIQKMDINPYINMNVWQKKNRPSHKIIWKLVIHRLNKIISILELITPYLTGAKQERASLILEFCKSRLSHYRWGSNRGNQITEREMEIIELCIAKQKRGISETMREAQLEQSHLFELIKARSIQRKKEYDKKWKKDNHPIVMERQRIRRAYQSWMKNLERCNQSSSSVGDDIVQPFAKA